MTAAGPRRRLRAYALTLVTTVIVLLFAFAEWWTEKYIADRSRVVSSAIEIAIVLVATLAFQPVHRRVEAAVEAAFTKRRRQALEALAKFRREITSFNDVGQLLRRVIEAIDHHVEAIGCAIYLRRGIYRAEASSFETPAENVEIDDPLAVHLRSTGRAAHPEKLHSAASGTIAFPMTVAGDLIGFLCVSSKHGEYDPEEAQTLALLAEAVGMALVTLDPQLRSESLSPNNLPADLPPLIGRVSELGEIKSLLEQSRLVTLTGAGGVGKTRMALHVAGEMRPTAGGIWFVDLAPIQDAGLVASAIADVFDIADEAGERPLIERIATALKHKQVLIVLDNCEHVIVSAAAAVEHLLQNCPQMQILATSREPLGLSVEEPYRVPSMPVPPENEAATAEQASEYDAVALFVTRARTADRGFALTDENAAVVADIVRRLDGIAMAIELAAPRIKVLSLQQLAQRLDERFNLLTGGSRTALPRHQTLHALIGWSYDLLGEPEKQLLRRSAVFRGDWTLEAAEAVCADDHQGNWNVIDLLEALVDKSLVAAHLQGESRRYRLLESTRQFGAQRLDEAGERATTARRHCEYYGCAAQRAGESYWKTDSDAWSELVRDDLENYRAAIAWGLSDEGDPPSGALIVANLRWFWYATARREGQTLCEQALAACGAGAPARVRGLLAVMAAGMDSSAKAEIPAAQAAADLAGVDDFGRTEALAFVGIALGRAGHVPESCARLDEALVAARATQAPRLIGWVLSMVAYWFGAAGNTARARELLDEAAVVLRSCGDPWQLARLQLHRAEFLFGAGELEAAIAGAREAEAVFRERHGDMGLCVSVLNATAYLLAMGRFREAWTGAREGLDIAIRLDHPMAEAWAIGHLAELAAETGDTALAARLLGRADAVYRKTGGSREPTEQRGYDRALELIRADLPDDEMRELFLEGAGLTAQAAAQEALSVPQP